RTKTSKQSCRGENEASTQQPTRAPRRAPTRETLAGAAVPLSLRLRTLGWARQPDAGALRGVVSPGGSLRASPTLPDAHERLGRPAAHLRADPVLQVPPHPLFCGGDRPRLSRGRPSLRPIVSGCSRKWSRDCGGESMLRWW
ncbi:unnamed protein product, partial [Laminaria digitata]